MLPRTATVLRKTKETDIRVRNRFQFNDIACAFHAWDKGQVWAELISPTRHQ